MKVVSIYDKALGAYMTPWYTQSTGQAVRMFNDELARDGSEMKKHPTDYELYLLGEWHDENAKFHLLEQPEQLAKGQED